MTLLEVNSCTFSVIIPAYHDWGGLSRCIECLTRQEKSAEGFEVIIVNNDPGDSVPEWLQLPCNSRVIEECTPGSYAARNAGIRAARGEILAFTDADCMPEEDWISSAAQFFRSNPEVGRLGGRIRLAYAASRLSAAEIYETVYAFRQDEYVSEKKMAATANMFAKADIFSSVGLFRDDLFSGGDAEWGLRAEEAGFPIGYCDRVVVRHPARSTVRELSRKARRVAGGQAVIHGSRALHAHAAFVLSLLPPLGSIRRCFHSPVPLEHKLLAFLIRWWLRFVCGVEVLRLAYRARPERV